MHDDEMSSARLSTSSHRMALAATAALEAREAEAAKLKQRAQQLLRERSELALELEGLQETLGRMDRAVTRAREQAQALQAESAKYSVSDARRHSAQLSTLSKTVLREKQRRLSARNEVGSLQRQLVKKRAQHEALAVRAASFKQAQIDAAERASRTDGHVHEAQRLTRRLNQCKRELAELESQDARAPYDDGHDEGSNEHNQLETELEAHLNRLRQAASAKASGDHPSACHSAATTSSPQAAQILSVRQALASEQEHARSAAPALEASTGTWVQRQRRVLAAAHFVVPASGTRGDAVIDSAKWHAEARAFAAEARRVKRLQQDAAARRDAERSGWHDFAQETARIRHGQAAHPAAAEDSLAALRREVASTREAVHTAEGEAAALLQGGGACRARLDDAGRLLSRLNNLVVEVQGSL